MFRSITFAAALLTASAALADPIVYVKNSMRGDAIYLINSDGTGETKIYQAPREGRVPGQIDQLSISPDGTKVAFILNDSRLFIQNVSDPTDISEITIPGNCMLGGLDYRTDGKIYVSTGCSSIVLVDTSTDPVTVSTIVTAVNVSGLTARGNDLLYVDDVGSGLSGTLYLWTAADGSTGIGPISYSLPLYLDADGNTGVLSGRSSYRTIDLSPGAQPVAGCTTPAGMVEYSPDGTQMVYEFRNTLFVINSDCTGSPFRLARGADAVDW